MVFNDIVIDETFGMVQNEANDRREFSFTAPVSGFYRFEINLQQITQVCFQHDALNFHTHRLSILILYLIGGLHRLVRISLKPSLRQQHTHTNTSILLL